jgi:uncharacterized membrane protein YgcG
MEANPNDYDRQIPWIPQQNQYYDDRYSAGAGGARLATPQRPPVQQNQRLQQKSVNQKPKALGKMPKARALALANILKKCLVVVSLVSFGTLSGLVAFHRVATTSSNTSTTSSSSSQTSSSSSQTSQQSTSSSQNNDGNSFFNQGGNNFGSSNSSQAPVSGSSVS